MKYKISSDIPLPTRGSQTGKRKSSKLSISETLKALPAPTMHEMHSFVVPLKGRKLQSLRGQICGAMSWVRKEHPERKFATRYVDKEKGIRVWRIR